MERRKWYIYLFESGYYAGDTVVEGTLEEARGHAQEWASTGEWEDPVVEVRVQLWDGDPHEENTELVDEWYQYSRDPSKPDPYREAAERFQKEHENDQCSACGRVGPEIHTPGLGGMDNYLEWRKVEPHAYLGWCRCPCGQMWACVDESYVEEVTERGEESRKK